MLCRILNTCVFLIFIFPSVIAHWSHKELARRIRGDVNLYERQYYSGVRWTYYETGLGACGITNTDDQFIVALTTIQFSSDEYPSPWCFTPIVLVYNGQTANATIMDECMACPKDGLDLSPSLFAFFAPTGSGVLTGSWYVVASQTTTTTWEQTTSTPAYTPPLTTSSPTTYYVPSPTTSSTWPAYTSSLANSATTTSGWASGVAVPTGVATHNTTNPENILSLYNIVVGFGIMLTMAGECR